MKNVLITVFSFIVSDLHTMHRSTCTSESVVRCNHNNDDVHDDLDNDNEENEDPCLIGTPVCVPAVVWLEDSQGKNYVTRRFGITFSVN